MYRLNFSLKSAEDPAGHGDTRKRDSRLLLGIFGLALLLRLGFWFEISGTPLDRWHEWEQTDMATYLVQARQLSSVDWLAHEPYHPYHMWQQIAPPEKWLEWYGPHQFHQAPAYAYAIAVVERVLDNPLVWIKGLQLLLGALTCVLAAAVAGCLAGTVAAVTTGLLAATYGPLFYLEAQLLREGPAVFALLALTVLLACFATRGPAPDAGTLARQVLKFAVPLGLFATFHEMASVIAVAAALTISVVCARTGGRTIALGLGFLVLGYTLGFAPLLVRNVSVGAPAFSVSCRTQINFVHANEADAPQGGLSFTNAGPSPRFVEIIERADGSFPAAIAGVWRSYDGDFGRLIDNAGLRFRTLWHPGEIPDNSSYSFFRKQSGVLAFLPTFPIVFALGMAGWLASWWRLRDARQDLAAHAVFGLVLLGLVSSLTLIHPVARFRLYLVPLLWIYAGIGVAHFARFSQSREPRASAALASIALAAFALQEYLKNDPPPTVPRASDYSFASRIALEEENFDLARKFAEEAARQFPRKGSYYGNLGLALAQHGADEQALADFERAYAMQPRLPRILEALEQQRSKVQQLR